MGSLEQRSEPATRILTCYFCVHPSCFVCFLFSVHIFVYFCCGLLDYSSVLQKCQGLRYSEAQFLLPQTMTMLQSLADRRWPQKGLWLMQGVPHRGPFPLSLIPRRPGLATPGYHDLFCSQRPPAAAPIIGGVTTTFSKYGYSPASESEVLTWTTSPLEENNSLLTKLLGEAFICQALHAREVKGLAAA